MNTFKDRKLLIVYPGAGTRVAAFDGELAFNKLNKRHPQATITYPSIERTREQTRGCSGEYVVIEEITGEIMRLRYGFTCSAQLLALWGALAYGGAGDPVGTPLNAKQTLTIAGDGTVTFAFEGLTGTTPTINAATTAAELKTILEKLDSIKPGNVDVTGAPGTLVVEFIGDLAKAAMPAFTKTGSITVTANTAVGANKLHEITRSTLDAMTLTNLIVGFEGDTTDPDRYKNIAVNSINVTIPKGGKGTCELDLVGSAKAFAAAGFTLPGCVRIDPIYARNCRAKVNGQCYTKKLVELRWGYSNNIITDDDARDWDTVDISNLERGDRTTTFYMSHYGSKGDTLFGLGYNEQVVPLELHFGRPGDRFSWFAPLAKLRLDAQQTIFVGTKRRSAIPISGEAFENEDTGEVDYIEANIDQTTAFLLT